MPVHVDILQLQHPETARAGEQVTVTAVVQNDGDASGAITVSLGYWDGVRWQDVLGDFYTVAKGASLDIPYVFQMPNCDCVLVLAAYSWQQDRAVLDDTLNSAMVALVKDDGAPAAGFHARIIKVYPVNQAPVLSEVTVGARILNDGAPAGAFRLEVRLANASFQNIARSPSQALLPGSWSRFDASFIMPDLSLGCTLRPEVFNPFEGVWIATGSPFAFSIAPLSPSWPRIEIPASWRDALTTGWLNLDRGEWIDLEVFGFGIVIPPMDIKPGYLILDVMDLAVGAINWVIEESREIYNRLQGAFSMAGDALDQVGDWISGAVGWFTTHADSWWDSTFEAVQGWVSQITDPITDAIGELYGEISDLGASAGDLWGQVGDIPALIWAELQDWDVFTTIRDMASQAYDIATALPEEIGDFFHDPAGWIFDKIDDWLNGEE